MSAQYIGFSNGQLHLHAAKFPIETYLWPGQEEPPSNGLLKNGLL